MQKINLNFVFILVEEVAEEVKDAWDLSSEEEEEEEEKESSPEIGTGHFSVCSFPCLQ